MRDKFYKGIVSDYVNRSQSNHVVAIDLETIIRNPNEFLSNERIIVVSVSYFAPEMKTELYIARDDSQAEEERILTSLDTFIGNFRPAIIIGYNHTGYDIPLIRMKLKNRSYGKQLWNLKYFLSVAYCLDMMQVIADHLAAFDGDYRFRKLSEVVVHEAFGHLNLDRKKYLVIKDGKNIGEAIEEMWRSGSSDFEDYCRGDTRDILSIFQEIFCSSER